MSNLGKRTSSRAISRPNVVRALVRITRELEALVDNAPMVWGSGQESVDEKAKSAIATVRDTVCDVYAISSNDYGRLSGAQDMLSKTKDTT